MADEQHEEPRRKLKIFGRDVSEIPCFRNSFLYGMGGGIVCGTLTFLGTSRTRLATHVGFGTFCCGTICYWIVCRYQWSKTRFEYQQLRTAMKQHALYEGTDIEKEVLKSSENA